MYTLQANGQKPKLNRAAGAFVKFADSVKTVPAGYCSDLYLNNTENRRTVF